MTLIDCWKLFLISFLGSVVPGYLNYSCMWFSSKLTFSQLGLRLLGLVLLEVPHFLLACFLSHQAWFLFAWQKEIDALSIVVLLVLGILIWRKKYQSLRLFSNRQLFFYTLFNPFAIPFWVFYLKWLQIDVSFYNSSFLFASLATSLGALLALYLYTCIGRKIQLLNVEILSTFQKCCAIVFGVMAIFQTIQSIKANY